MTSDFLFCVERMAYSGPAATTRTRAVSMLIGCVCVLSCCAPAVAQTDAAPRQQANAQTSSATLPEAPSPQDDTLTVRKMPGNVYHDQIATWTSPARIRPHDLKWLVPLTLATGVAIATDHRAMKDVVSHDPVFNHESVDASNVMETFFFVTPVALFGYGHMEHDEHARDAGLTGSEALIDAAFVEQGLKLIAWRERPHNDDYRGRFFQTSVGPDSSFPSSHTVFAWASAAVLADEYPSPMARFGIYSLATGVNITRVLGQEHFPSDVIVGSAAGWLVGHYVYGRRHRHDRSRH